MGYLNSGMALSPIGSQSHLMLMKPDDLGYSSKALKSLLQHWFINSAELFRYDQSLCPLQQPHNKCTVFDPREPLRNLDVSQLLKVLPGPPPK